MKRINTPRAANTFQGPPGGTGHWQDTSPLGGTQFDAQWCEAMQEAVAETIEGLGVPLAGDETGQLWGALAPRVQGQISGATMAVGPTPNTRIVVGCGEGASAVAPISAAIASTIAVASGTPSAVVASIGGFASGDGSLVAAAVSSEAAGAESAVVAGVNAIASGGCSILVASENAELHDDHAVAIGRGSGPIGKVNANQNLRVRITARPTTTDIGLQYEHVDLAPGVWAATIHAPMGRIYQPDGIAAGGEQTLVVTNSLVSAHSVIFAACEGQAGSEPVPTQIRCGAGQFEIQINNYDPLLVTVGLYVRFIVLNPAMPP